MSAPQPSIATQRCTWPGTDPLALRYHDEEWGVPTRDDGTHFEFLVLESAQAGLSWMTILRKREHYQQAYYGFDPQRVAEMGPTEVEGLLANPGIVRNRRKIEASINNAMRFLEIQREVGSFAAYLWRCVADRPVTNHWQRMDQLPATTELSIQVAGDLKRRGFKFLGPTTVYAHLQATGLVNDHLVSCYRHGQLASAQEGNP